MFNPGYALEDRTERISRSINEEARAALPALVRELKRRVSVSEFRDWRGAATAAVISGEYHNLRWDIARRLEELDAQDDSRDNRPY